MKTTRHILIQKPGSADTLCVTSCSEDKPLEADEVRIAVSYSGINFADIQMRLGFYPDAPKRPYVPGYEVSGTVEAVGANVDEVEVGQPVVAGTYFGGYTSKITVPLRQVLPLPKGLSLDEGAALPVNFFTAHLALFEMARVRAGDRVLIECATGGVGTLAAQMAIFRGAHVTGLTTSPNKLPYIENLGMNAMTRDDFERDTAVDNFDFILNASGGQNVNPQRERLKITGRMVCIGVSSGVKDGRRNLLRMGVAALRTPRVGVIGLMNANTGIYGLNALKVLQDEDWVMRLKDAFSSVEEMALKPYVDRIFPADDVGQAHRFIETKKAKGKILLAWNETC